MAKIVRLYAYELTRKLSTAKLARICACEVTRMEFFRSGVTHLLLSDYSTSSKLKPPANFPDVPHARARCELISQSHMHTKVHFTLVVPEPTKRKIVSSTERT